MLQLAPPARHEWLVRERGHGKMVMEPFEPGLALTVGNTYRRVLLSSIPGAAPTWVKIEGVLHEFSHLQGVNEGTLEMEVCVERGRGYQAAEKREPEALPIHAMLIDTDFSPVERANFSVEAVETSTGPQERLLLELWTDGSVTPEAAVAEAARILEDQFNLFTDFMHAAPPPVEPGETGTEPVVRMELNEHLFRSVDE